MRRRASHHVLLACAFQAPLFLLHALQLMFGDPLFLFLLLDLRHLPMQYPMRFADPVANPSNPKNEDLRRATYGALRSHSHLA